MIHVTYHRDHGISIRNRVCVPEINLTIPLDEAKDLRDQLNSCIDLLEGEIHEQEQIDRANQV